MILYWILWIPIVFANFYIFTDSNFKFSVVESRGLKVFLVFFSNYAYCIFFFSGFVKISFFLIFISNIIIYYVAKSTNILKLDPDYEDKEVKSKLNTLSRNPKVVKDIFVSIVSVINVGIGMVSSVLLHRVPQSFDMSLMALQLPLLSMGFFTPLAFWLSNKNLQSYTQREFFPQFSTLNKNSDIVNRI